MSTQELKDATSDVLSPQHVFGMPDPQYIRPVAHLEQAARSRMVQSAFEMCEYASIHAFRGFGTSANLATRFDNETANCTFSNLT